MAWTAPWALAEPTPTYMLELLLTISAVAIGLSAVFQTSKSPSGLLQKCGVSLQRVARAVREVERKMFHICLLLAPLVQMSLLKIGWANADCQQLVWSIAAVTCATDMIRLKVPAVMRMLESVGAKRIMRSHEHSQLTGGFYMGLGVAMTMTIARKCTHALIHTTACCHLSHCVLSPHTQTRRSRPPRCSFSSSAT